MYYVDLTHKEIPDELRKKIRDYHLLTRQILSFDDARQRLLLNEGRGKTREIRKKYINDYFDSLEKYIEEMRNT